MEEMSIEEDNQPKMKHLKEQLDRRPENTHTLKSINTKLTAVEILRMDDKELIKALIKDLGEMKKRATQESKVYSGENGSVLSNINQTNYGYNQALSETVANLKKLIK